MLPRRRRIFPASRSPSLASTTAPPPAPPSPLAVLKEFAETTTLHGVRFLVQTDVNGFDRACWAAALAACAVCAAVFVGSAWDKYRLSPTITSVETTMYPLWRIAFPAVTVCSSSNIRQSRAEELLLQFLDASRNASPQLKMETREALQALAKFRFPYYHEMQEHVEAASALLPRLDALNVTDFMLQVMPSCVEMFYRCLWQGRVQNCCELFQLQRFEGGFCYSFNSLTSENTSHCMSRQAQLGLSNRGQQTAFGPECDVRRNSGSGMSSGLEIFLHHTESVKPLHQREGSGYQIILHDSTNFPQLGRGLFLPTRRGSKTSGALKVIPTITETAAEVRSLPPAARQCYFRDEKQLSVNSEYTMGSCLLECRLNRLRRACGCVPYFFSVVDAELRVPRPPPHTEGFNASTAGLDCLHCLPACFDRSYTASTTSTTAWDAGDEDYSAYVDVYYDELGGVKYRKDLVVGTVDLVVSLGGIASLFLGVSLLTGAELLYFVGHLLRSIVHATSEWLARPPAPSPPPAPSQPPALPPPSPHKITNTLPPFILNISKTLPMPDEKTFRTPHGNDIINPYLSLTRMVPLNK